MCVIIIFGGLIYTIAWSTQVKHHNYYAILWYGFRLVVTFTLSLH